jgi:hypothetical protein
MGCPINNAAQRKSKPPPKQTTHLPKTPKPDNAQLSQLFQINVSNFTPMADFLDRALSWSLDSLLRDDDDDDEMPDVSDLLSDDSVLWDDHYRDWSSTSSSSASSSDNFVCYNYDGSADPLFPEFDLVVAATASSEDLSSSDEDDSLSMMEQRMLAYDPTSDSPFALPFEKRFEATKRSLEECMKKSQETRRSLTLTSYPEHEGMQEFLKQRASVQGVVESVQASTRKLQKWVVPGEKKDKRRR